MLNTNNSNHSFPTLQAHSTGYDVPMENITAEFARHFARRVGYGLRMVRDQLELTQAAVAERMTEAGYPMSRVQIAKTESASRPVPVEELAAFAAVLDVPVTYLIPGLLDESAQSAERRSIENQLLLAESTEVQLRKIVESLSSTSESLRARYATLEGFGGIDQTEA